MAIFSLDASDVILGLLLAIGLYMDLRYRRLPNWLTFSGILLGIVYQSFIEGWAGALDAIGGVLFAAVLILPFMAGGMGGGDVKFLAAIGAIKGLHFGVWSALYGAVAGGLVSIAILVWQGRLAHEIWRCFLWFKTLAVPKSERPVLKPERKQESLFPYGVVLAIGAIVVRWIGV